MNLVDRFLRYTRYDTQSCEDSESVPSTNNQMLFAKHLRDELLEENFEDVYLDDKGYLYATLPSNNCCEDIPVIGFISHYDTSPDSSGRDVHARIIEHYNGGDISLGNNLVLSNKTFPELLLHIGEDLIVTDGTTLLGADDKAGIAEIVQAMCYLRDHSEKIKHGKIRIAFTPDEEIGRGARYFNVPLFGCDWAYTMDGGDIGGLEFENFNAACAKIHIRGVSVHPGYAKGKMINALRLGAELIDLVPKDETPEETFGYQGFYHLNSFSGNVEEATLIYIIRDHDRKRFEARKAFISHCVEKINNKLRDSMTSKYDREDMLSLELKDQYFNMREIIESRMFVVDIAKEAMKACGITPKIEPIRGGTDGAQLSFKGLPCPNIFAGGVNFHGPYEFISVQVMHKAMEVVVKIAEIVASHYYKS